jgi:hypothetical protein
MTNVNAVLIELKQQREKLDRAIASLEGISVNGSARRRSGGRRTISAAGRARIAAAQRKRWALVKARQKKH